MSTASILESLKAAGIELSVVDGQLKITGSKHKLSPELIGIVRDHKEQLIAEMASKPTSISKCWDMAIDSLMGDPDFPDDLIDRLRDAEIRTTEVVTDAEKQAIVSAMDTVGQAGCCDDCRSDLVAIPTSDGYFNRFCLKCLIWKRCINRSMIRTERPAACNSRAIPNEIPLYEKEKTLWQV